MQERVFHIKKLLCSYDHRPENAVLYIDDLEIRKGEIIFLLGSSGSGKSTLLETLGLMSSPIASGEVLFYSSNNEVTDFTKLWQEDDVQKASEIRKANFSFIFQNTNLMENFTAYENVSLSRMIQKGSSQSEAMDGAKRLMERVGLPQDQVPVDKLSVNLSGGQRQRVTFVRALNSDCTVLFGDEPTGNLDEGNANELMNVVKSYLTEKQLTTIIVSHDIHLALNHASRIVCLTKDPQSGRGEILPENNFPRSAWETLSADDLQIFQEKIRSFYTQRTDTKQTKDQTSHPIKLSKGYTSLFLSKEGKALAGKGYLYMLILIMLLLCTFLAIGFANGSLAYLKEKIDNPFVNWLTIDIPYSKGNASDVRSIINEISDHKSEFFIRSVSSFSERPIAFYISDSDKYIPTRARSVVNVNDPLVSTLIDDNNRFKGKKSFLSDNDLSVIVTRRFMDEHGYSEDAPFIYLENHEYEDSLKKRVQFRVPIGVRAVVKEMPGKAQMIYTEYFNKAKSQSQGNPFDLRNKKDMILFLATSRKEAQDMRVKIKEYLKGTKWSKGHEFDIELPTLSSVTYYEGYDIVITPSPVLNKDEWQMLFDDIATQIPESMHRAYYFNYYNFTEDFSVPSESDKISIIFSKLDKVRAFHDYCLNALNDQDAKDNDRKIEPDLANVKEKENFNFLSHITQIVSYILILFGTISVSLFIFNLLKMHLSKVKMNIGTFKAFGLSNSEAQKVYFLIILRFLVLSLIISLILSAGLGYLLNAILTKYFVLDAGAGYFNLLYLYTYITLGLIFVSALTVSWFTIRNMLSKSPGDLIYNRS